MWIFHLVNLHKIQVFIRLRILLLHLMDLRQIQVFYFGKNEIRSEKRKMNFFFWKEFDPNWKWGIFLIQIKCWAFCFSVLDNDVETLPQNGPAINPWATLTGEQQHSGCLLWNKKRYINTQYRIIATFPIVHVEEMNLFSSVFF